MVLAHEDATVLRFREELTMPSASERDPGARIDTRLVDRIGRKNQGGGHGNRIESKERIKTRCHSDRRRCEILITMIETAANVPELIPNEL